MKKDDYFAPCAICGKPAYKPIFNVWPWKCFARNIKKTLWFCSEKCFLQWKKDKDIDTLGRNYGRKRIPCKDGVETVRQIRIRKGIPAKAISSMLGVGASTYCHLEKGAQAWHKEWLPAIAKVLGESVDYIKWQSISVSKGPEEVLEFHPEGLPEDPDDSDSSDDAPKKRKPYHEHYYISKIDTGTKTLVEILKDKDIAQKELAFKVGLKIMKFRACLYGHNAWPRSADSELDHCPICGYKPKDESPINGDKTGDKIHHPNHYNWRGTECKNCIWEFEGDEGYKRYCEGNIMKYLYRYEKKGTPLQDLMKGREYWDFLIEQKKRELAAQEAEEAYQNFSHADSLHAGKLDK